MEYFDFYGSHQDTALFTVLATKPVGEWKIDGSQDRDSPGVRMTRPAKTDAVRPISRHVGDGNPLKRGPSPRVSTLL